MLCFNQSHLVVIETEAHRYRHLVSLKGAFLRIDKVIAYSNKWLSKQDDVISHWKENSLELFTFKGLFLNLDLSGKWTLILLTQAHAFVNIACCYPC